jgi:hypothetical protein
MTYTSGIFLNNTVGFKIGTVDLSSHVTAFSLARKVDSLEVTAMGDTSHKFVSGLSADTITVSFLNDRGANSVLATLQSNYGNTVAFTAIQDTTAAVSTTNVLYTGYILIDNVTDINGAVADEAVLDITFTCNAKTAIASTGTWA